jgi:phage protein D
MKKPDWRITLEGEEVDPLRLVELSTTDNRGLEVDTLVVTFSDQDGLLALPAKGVELALFLGYLGEELVDRGTFVVDAVRHTGPPDQLEITAKSARVSQKNGRDNVNAEEGEGPKLKERREYPWDDITLGDMLAQIAGRHGLEVRVSKELEDFYFRHIDQCESDQHFLTRIAEDLDAVATVKAGRLLFLQAGKGENAEGQKIDRIMIERKDGDAHEYEAADKCRYTGCSAHWHDHTTGKRERVDTGKDGYRKQLPRTYPSEAEALRAAESEFQRLGRGLATIRLSIADADPALFAETPTTLSGWDKPEIDNDRWVITRVTIGLDPSRGLGATIQAEERPEE